MRIEQTDGNAVRIGNAGLHIFNAEQAPHWDTDRRGYAKLKLMHRSTDERFAITIEECSRRPDASPTCKMAQITVTQSDAKALYEFLKSHFGTAEFSDVQE